MQLRPKTAIVGGAPKLAGKNIDGRRRVSPRVSEGALPPPPRGLIPLLLSARRRPLSPLLWRIAGVTTRARELEVHPDRRFYTPGSSLGRTESRRE